MPEPEDRSPVDRFLDEFWSDVDADRVLSAEEYVARHPGLDASRIRRELAVFLSGPTRPEREPDGAALAPLVHEPGAAARPPALPARVGRYVVERALGEGGMGLVLLGRDPELARAVVVKTLHARFASDERSLERLRREARIAGRIDHDGICPVLDVVEEASGRVYLVLPFIEGETLADRLAAARRAVAARGVRGKRDRATPFEAIVGSRTTNASGSDVGESRPSGGGGDLRHVVRLAERIALAAHALHEAGIVHRDLKPGNVMIRPDGAPVILDFGLALDSSNGAALRLTQEGDPLGTPLYMAPEQVEARLDGVDRRTDVHALGVILYELLTLRTPYEAPSREAVYRMILHGNPLAPHKFASAIPRDLEAVCLKALASEPAARYATALALAEDLRRVRTLEPTLAKPPSILGRLLRRVRRHPGVALGLAAGLVLAVAAAYAAARWRGARFTVDDYSIALAALREVAGGRAPSPEQITRLSRLLPDAAARQRFLANPADVLEWEKVERALAERMRSGGDGNSAGNRLLAPRAGIADDAPVFRFTVPKPGGERWRYRLSLRRNGEPERVFEIEQAADDPGPLAFALPSGERLAPGKYVWSVELDPGRHAEFADLYCPEPAEFSVLDPAVVRSLPPLDPAEREPLPALLRASAALAHGLVAESAAALDRIGPGAPAEIQALARLLRAETAALVGERARFYALLREAAPR